MLVFACLCFVVWSMSAFACVFSFGASSLVCCRLGNALQLGVSAPSGYFCYCVRLVMTCSGMPHTSLSGVGHTLW